MKFIWQFLRGFTTLVIGSGVIITVVIGGLWCFGYVVEWVFDKKVTCIDTAFSCTDEGGLFLVTAVWTGGLVSLFIGICFKLGKLSEPERIINKYQTHHNPIKPGSIIE